MNKNSVRTGYVHMELWLKPCNKEHLALVNNFAVNKKFLITNFDCT